MRIVLTSLHNIENLNSDESEETDMAEKNFYIASAFVVNQSRKDDKIGIITHLFYSFSETEAEDGINARASELSDYLEKGDVVGKVLSCRRFDLLEILPYLGDSEKDEKDKMIAVTGMAYKRDGMDMRHYRLMVTVWYEKNMETAMDKANACLYEDFPIEEDWEGQGMIAEIFSATLVKGYVEEDGLIKNRVPAITAPMQLQ